MDNLKVEQDLGYGTGEEAIRVLKRAKKWSPGIMRGVPVRVQYSIPIRLDMTTSNSSSDIQRNTQTQRT